MGPSLDCLLWKSCKYSMFTYYTLCVIVHVMCNFVDLHVKLILVFFLFWNVDCAVVGTLKVSSYIDDILYSKCISMNHPSPGKWSVGSWSLTLKWKSHWPGASGTSRSQKNLLYSLPHSRIWVHGGRLWRVLERANYRCSPEGRLPAWRHPLNTLLLW